MLRQRRGPCSFSSPVKILTEYTHPRSCRTPHLPRAPRCSGPARRPHGVPHLNLCGVGGVIVLAEHCIEDWLVRVGLRLG
eukprot:9700593-Lingulodinium_polyedra.AAC.1